MDWHCKVEDCSLHPKFIEEERKKREKKELEDSMKLQDIRESTDSKTNNIIYKWVTTASTGVKWGDSINNDSSFFLKTPYLKRNIPIECLLCSHMEKIDMRNVIIAHAAKKALRS